jgi:hypothetical protein
VQQNTGGGEMDIYKKKKKIKKKLYQQLSQYSEKQQKMQ